jgi:transposase
MRELAMRLLTEGKTGKEIASIIGVSEPTLSRWRHRESLTPSPKGGSKPREIGVDILEHIANNPGKTIKELEVGLPIKRTAILQRLHKAGYTFKKKVTRTKKATR